MYTSQKKVSQKYIMAIKNNFSGKRKKAATSNAMNF